MEATSAKDAWLASDETMGPGNSQIFDFTLTFENSILSILPAACLLLIVFPLHVRSYSRRPRVASVGRLYSARLVTAIAIVAMEVARSVVWCRGRFPDSTLRALSATSLASAVCGPLNALIFLAMMHVEYFHAIYSSSVLGASLSIMLLLDAARARGFWIRSAFAPVGQLSLTIVILQIAFLVLQEIPKTLNSSVTGSKRFFYEAKAGFWNRMLMLWVNGFLLLGYRTSLTLQHLGCLGPDFSTERLVATFDATWEKADKKAKGALIWTCLRTFFSPFMAGAIPRVVLSIAKFSLPLTIQQILVYMDDLNANPSYLGGLVGAIVLGYVVNGISYGMVSYYMNRLATYLRGVLIIALFQKNLKLGLTEAKAAAAVGLMSADVEGLVQDVERIHDITLLLPEVAVGLYLFWTVIGNAFFIIMGSCAVTAATLWYLGGKNGAAYSRWNEGIQDRLAESVIILGHMKGIRMIGLDRVIAKYMHALREREIAISKPARLLKMTLGVLYTFFDWSLYIVTLLAGLYWTVWRDGLDPVTVWPAIAYQRLVASPFTSLFKVYPQLAAIAARFQRIQDFLNLPEPEDKREIMVASTAGPAIDGLSASGPTITFCGVYVQARDQSHNVLEDVNFEVAASTLAMVVGSVGSGKSVLLKAILGEAQASHGLVKLSSAKIAFCDQVPWLPDLSIRDAVIGESPVDEDRYAEVLAACSLEYDIQQLPQGDATLVGANGSKMSGGQKQRIALARAVYSLMPIVVCDDVLSALDAETAQSVFTNVFSSTGVLKKQGRTAVLATHSVQWLPSADQVIVTKEGKVSILENDEEILKYSQTAVLSVHDSYADEETPVVDDGKTALAFAVAAKNTRGTNRGLYRFMLQAVLRWQWYLFVAFCLFLATGESFQEIYIRIWLQDAPSNKLYIFGMIGVMCYAMMSDVVTYWLYQMMLMPTVSFSLHSIFVEKVMSATLPFVTSSSAGALLNRFSQDMTLIGQELPGILFHTIYSGALSMISIVVVASSAQYAALSIPVILILLWAIQYFYLETSRQVRLLDLETKTPLYAKLNEMLSGVEHIRGFGWQQQTLKTSMALINDSQTPFYYMFTIQRWLYIVLTLTGSGMAVIVCTMALYLTRTTSQASAGLGLINATHFTFSIIIFIQDWTKLETSLGAITRLKSFVEETPCESDDGRTAPPSSWPAHGAIEFKDVSARYSSEPGAPAVIKNISLQVLAGEKVVIVGRTGSGKSTMILTMLDFLAMTGNITIDGVDISTVPHNQLRVAITTLPQDSIETLGSVRDNLLPFDIEGRLKTLAKDDKPSDEKKANSEDADKFIEKPSKGGSETMVVEVAEKGKHAASLSSGTADRTAELDAVLRQVKLLDVINKKGGLGAAAKDLHLSSGQRQLFNLARAILHKRDTGSKIVLMDEVTSHMDYETDKTIQALLDSEFGDCTRIIISHRATGHATCDKLVTMQDGRIVSIKQMKRATGTEEVILAVGDDGEK